MFLVRNMKSVWHARREALLLAHLSSRQLRLLGAAFGALLPFALALLFLFQTGAQATFAAGLCLYASAIGALVGAWRAPPAVSSNHGNRQAVSAGIAGAVIGTAILICAYSTLAVVSDPVPGVVLIVLLILVCG